MPTADTPRRSRRLIVAGVVVVLVVLVGVAVLIGRQAGDDDQEGSPASAAEPGDGRGGQAEEEETLDGDVEVIVYLDPDTTEPERQALEAKLADDPAIRGFSYVDRAATYEEFLRLFEDEPEFVDDVRPEDLPTSFKVVPEDASASSVRRIKAAYEGESGVKQVVTATGLVDLLDRSPLKPGVEVAIYLNPGASEEQRRAIETALEADAAVKDFEYLDKAAMFDELRPRIEEDPDVAAGAGLEDMPTSFEVDPEDSGAGSLRRIEESYEDEPGVLVVKVAT
jgi:cell division protein FtsX